MTCVGDKLAGKMFAIVNTNARAFEVRLKRDLQALDVQNPGGNWCTERPSDMFDRCF